MEPTTSGFVSWAAGATIVTMAVLGVDYYSVLYSLAGAYFSVLHADGKHERWKTIVLMVLCTIIGAAMGNGAVQLLQLAGKAVLNVLCIVGGFGAHAILYALLDRALSKIKPGDQK